MRVLLTGVTGYVGGHLARRLLTDGHIVTALVRTEAAAQDARERGMSVQLGDARTMTFGTDLLDGQDAVVWAAQLMLEDEERAVRQIASALRDTGKAFLFTSGTSLLSQSTHGEWSDDSFAEDDDFVPRRQVAPRRQIETLVRTAAQGGVRAMVVRPPLIWGHGGCRIVADLYHSARVTGAVCHVGRGLNVYTHVHIDDLADLYARALDRGAPGALYHAGAGEVDFRTMAAAIARHLGIGTRSVSVPEAQTIWDAFMGPIVFSGCSRTRAPRSRMELGWRPDPERVDLLAECVVASYSTATHREPPSWVRRG